jgi:hypothetical protein
MRWSGLCFPLAITAKSVLPNPIVPTKKRNRKRFRLGAAAKKKPAPTWVPPAERWKKQ